MIIDIKKVFSAATLGKKIEYQLKKIEKGCGRELYSSSGIELKHVSEVMQLISTLNDRIKNPFVEFVLSLPAEESLSDEKFAEFAKEYMSGMGYDESCYSIIINDDTDNKHVHIIATTIDTNGKKINDSLNYSRSNAIARKLEKKYGLTEPKKKGFSKSSLGESQHRTYYFDAALKKGLRNNTTKSVLSELLQKSDMYRRMSPDLNVPLKNEVWEIMLGSSLFDEIGGFLKKKKFFNVLLKSELLNAMDRIYSTTSNAAEFRKKLQEEGYYMRLVSSKGKAHYVYGIPGQSFYVKDSTLSQRYRYGVIKFDGHRMNLDEQKHYLYGQIFSLLNQSKDYEEFKKKLSDNDIKITEYRNRQGIYGLSFTMNNVESSVEFKASDISRRLSYNNIQSFFCTNSVEIERVITNMDAEQWKREIDYILPAIVFTLGSGGRQRKKEEDDEQTLKKKKKKGKQQQRSM
jgi:hypothetical protein